MPDEAGLTEPAPVTDIVTKVAFENVLPLTVTGAMPQVFPLLPFNVRVGPFIHPHDTEKLLPVEVHPDAFLTDMV